MSDDKYRPRSFVLDDPGPDPVSLINEPVAPDNVSTLVRPKQRSLHAVLCEGLNNTQALLSRLEAGVVVPRDQQRETVRELYVATRHHAWRRTTRSRNNFYK